MSDSNDGQCESVLLLLGFIAPECNGTAHFAFTSMKLGSPQVLKKQTKMREADSQNTNSSTSCTTHVTEPTQVHSLLFVCLFFLTRL